MDSSRSPAFLTGNTLKILAALSMVIDHVGLMFFPHIRLLRILGRLSFPIFVFMIAEGCKYTRNRKKYFLSVFSMAAVCQVVYFFFDGSTYMSILVTFSLSILMIYALQTFQKTPGFLTGLLFAAAVATVYILNQIFTLDYGFWGCMVPVFAAVFHHTKFDRIPVHTAMLGLGLLLLAMEYGGTQYYALLSLPLLLLYSGKRGKHKMKYFFYIFYPTHLVLLQGLAFLLE